MPIVATDLLLKYSVKTGAAGNSQAGTADGSLGKYISTTQVPDATLHNLFDAVTGLENEASEAEYRCIFVHNAHATLTLQNARAYIQTEAAGGASIAIGVDPTAASAIGSAGAQAVEVANENTAPVGPAFSSPVDYATGVALGSIAAGQCKALWVRRTAADTAPVSGDSVVLAIQGETY